MTDLRLGILLWSQGSDWPSMERAAIRVDERGYDHLWTWDHLYAIFGDPYQPIFEGWMALAAWSKVTTRAKLGLLVGAIPFRNPGLVAKLATTLDHQSDGRAILGLGGAWMDLEHQAHGIDFGSSVGERLDWLDEAVGGIRGLLEGRSVTSAPGGHYAFDDLRQAPLPIQRRLPIMIGGSGEKKTLRTVARYADIWNAMGEPDFLRHKVEVLGEHCADVGRDIAEIQFTFACKPVIRDTEAEARRVFQAQMAHNRTPSDPAFEKEELFWVGSPRMLADRILALTELGFTTGIAELAAPYDDETIDRFIGDVKPLVDAG